MRHTSLNLTNYTLSGECFDVAKQTLVSEELPKTYGVVNDLQNACVHAMYICTHQIDIDNADFLGQNYLE